ncbi:Uncharacterised protein [Mycobacteroides abscessus subsp. abscessus]|uniref:hypothetical protein n=1 Tax=Mycobacteroides abscessus TaxID=36809 RepID=UPI0009298E21|nr:hypothetical protein [Mycobacteroides abscessus]SHU29270.1 Uncharacterised protein [Mycobacteroides abscessus subsp. abscessus]
MTGLRQAIRGLRLAAYTHIVPGQVSVVRGVTTETDCPHADDGPAGVPEAYGTDRSLVEAAISQFGWHGHDLGAIGDSAYIGYVSADNTRRASAYYRHGTELAWAVWNDRDDSTADTRRCAGWQPGLTARFIDYIRSGELKAVS